MRIVRVCGLGLEQANLDQALWKLPRPSSIPYLCDSDITTLHKLQREQFAPASTVHIDPINGHLEAIKVYSQLGFGAGINGMQFVYDTGLVTSWGYVEDSVSIPFFLDKTERIVEVTVYQMDSKVRHIQVRRHTH